MAKTLTLSLAVVAVVLLGAAAGQPQGHQRVLAPIGQFGRNTAARLAAAGADGIAAVAKIGTNVVGSVQDTVNTGLDLGSSLTRTGTTFVGDRATSLADTGSTIATFSQTAVKTGVRIGQDAVKAGLAVAGNGADAVNGLAGGRLGLGNRLVQSGLGAAGRVSNCRVRREVLDADWSPALKPSAALLLWGPKASAATLPRYSQLSSTLRL